MSLNLPEEKVAEFKTVFNKFDKDGDSALSLEELTSVMKYLEMDFNQSELKNMVFLFIIFVFS
jgi:Ca2+-binding EF-hand superfamily protein